MIKMLILGTGKVIPDEQVVFDDGFLNVICQREDGTNKRIVIYICLNPEYDKPMTLVDIAKNYPNVKMVIYDEFLKGAVYRYGNHDEGIWEQVGTTIGFA